jgi:hypothetical protein
LNAAGSLGRREGRSGLAVLSRSSLWPQRKASKELKQLLTW